MRREERNERANFVSILHQIKIQTRLNRLSHKSRQLLMWRKITPLSSSHRSQTLENYCIGAGWMLTKHDFSQVCSNSLGSAQQENNSREESRRVLLHAAEVLDTGPEDKFDR